jgi:hypothetical protein
LLYKKYLEFIESRVPKDLYNTIIDQNNEYDFILAQIYNNYNKFDFIIQTIIGPRLNINLYNIIFGIK